MRSGSDEGDCDKNLNTFLLAELKWMRYFLGPVELKSSREFVGRVEVDMRLILSAELKSS